MLYAPAGFDSSADGVGVHRDGVLLYANLPVIELLGYERPGDIVGRLVTDFLRPEDRPRLASRLAACAEPREGEPEPEVLIRRDGTPVAVELSSAAVPAEDGPLCFLFVKRLARPGAQHLVSGEPAAPLAEVGRKRGTGAETILICDDEARLASLTAGLLEDCGYRPLAVGTGDRAVELLSGTDTESVQVLLLDVNLSSGMSAREVLSVLEARQVDVPVVLTSGLSREDIPPALATHAQVFDYLAKPYTVEDLVACLRRVLDRSGGSPPGAAAAWR